MNRAYSTGRMQSQRSGKFLAGVLLCALVTLFALVAKVSWYQTSSPAAPTMSTQKAFKAELPTAQSVTTVAHQPALLPVEWMPALLAIAASLLCLKPAPVTTTSRLERQQAGFAHAWAARPPPAR